MVLAVNIVVPCSSVVVTISVIEGCVVLRMVVGITSSVVVDSLVVVVAVVLGSVIPRTLKSSGSEQSLKRSS